MEKITAMKITGLTLTNFRNHTEPEHYDFGDISYISGHNGTGKTTMAHAVCYALYGVSYYGESKIERLRNEDTDTVTVTLAFTDQNGAAHTLQRNRQNDRITLTLDGYTVRQKEIEQQFCDKDTFLAMFNPTYLTERMGDKGRTLMLRYLPHIDAKTVINELNEHRPYLAGVDLDNQAPEEMLKGTRQAIRDAEQQISFLEGHIDTVMQAQASAEQKLTELHAELRQARAAVEELEKKQFAGIDADDLAIQRNLLLEKLATADAAEDPQLAGLRAKLTQVQLRPYESKFTGALAETAAQIQTLAEQYKELVARIGALKPGDRCPSCMRQITEENIGTVRSEMAAQAKQLAEKGKAAVERKKELQELEQKSRKTFEQFKADDRKRLSAEIETLTANRSPSDRSAVQAKIAEIEELQQYGNLDENEYGELNCKRAEITGIQAQIQTVEGMADDSRLGEAREQKKTYEQLIGQYTHTVDALKEFIWKRTELATEKLQMPNVRLRLYDIVRSTGEVVSAFRFDYKGRDYTTLSLSEKTLAGVEICAMMRRITGIDCPVCIDNTESIASFNAVEMPSQVWMLRFVKGKPLTVQSKDNAPVIPLPNTELKKAG